jgi:hypothetical protein
MIGYERGFRTVVEDAVIPNRTCKRAGPNYIRRARSADVGPRLPNQGAGAASARIETARRHFPRIFFNAETTEDGRDALGWYHEKNRTMTETWGSAQITIGVRTPRTVLA